MGGPMNTRTLSKNVHRSWLDYNGLRLDSRPYLGGALETHILLDKLHAPKQPLRTLTAGYNGGIYNGPIFVRNYVDDPAYGVPMLTSGSMLLADLSRISLLRKSDAESPRLSYLRVQEGMTLISCSGTIGRMTYSRPDMAGFWSSQDVLKVVADPDKVLPGYLYAYLSSRFGVPLVVSGTYGAIIQHIEPQHIADLPVPIPPPNLGEQVHLLMSNSAQFLARYQELMFEATKTLFKVTGVENPSRHEWYSNRSDLGFTVSSRGTDVLRAWNHSQRVQTLKQQITSGKWNRLGELVEPTWLRWRKMFERIDVDPEYGIEVITQKALFRLFPEGRWLSRDYLLNHSPKYIVPDKTILIAKQGTLGEDELYCRCEFITGNRMLEKAYSDHCMRVVAVEEKIWPGYLFTFLRSETGFRLLRSLSEGSKQQDLHYRTVPELPIPRCDTHIEEKIHNMVTAAYNYRNKAVDMEIEARQIVEKWIERGGY